MDRPRQHPTTPPLTDEELSEVEEDVECGSPISRRIAFRLLPEVRLLRSSLIEIRATLELKEKMYNEALFVLAQSNKNAERVIASLESELAKIRCLAAPHLKAIEE